MIHVRTEQTNDYDQVGEVNYQAFGGRYGEQRLVERIRVSPQFIPELSIVAEIEGELIGHVLISRALIKNDNGETNVLVVAPVAVKPECQKIGVGKAMLLEGLERCKRMGYPLVFLIGHPMYYPKFGFQPARQFGFELLQFDVPNDVFMVCEIVAGGIAGLNGELRYPKSFFQ